MTLFDLINDSIRRHANNFQDHWHSSIDPMLLDHLKTTTLDDLTTPLPDEPLGETKDVSEDQPQEEVGENLDD